MIPTNGHSHRPLPAGILAAPGIDLALAERRLAALQSAEARLIHLRGVPAERRQRVERAVKRALLFGAGAMVATALIYWPYPVIATAMVGWALWRLAERTRQRESIEP